MKHNRHHTYPQVDHPDHQDDMHNPVANIAKNLINDVPVVSMVAKKEKWCYENK